MGNLLASLAAGDVLSPSNNQQFMDALQNTIYNTRIPAGLGYAVPVAHKTGSKDYVYNDAALVLLPDNPFVLVILSRGVPSSVQTLMRQLAADMLQFHQQRLQSGELQDALRLQAWLEQMSVIPSARVNWSGRR